MIQDYKIKIILLFLAALLNSTSLVYFIFELQDKNIELMEQNLLKDKEIAEIKKTAYKRFVIAKDLTEICNRFKSSREAKEKYYLKN